MILFVLSMNVKMLLFSLIGHNMSSMRHTALMVVSSFKVNDFAFLCSFMSEGRAEGKCWLNPRYVLDGWW